MSFTDDANYFISDPCSPTNSDLPSVTRETLFSSTSYFPPLSWTVREMPVFLSSSWQAFLSALAKTPFGVGGIMMTPSLTLVPRCSFLYHLVFFSSFLFKVFGSVDWLPSFVLSFHHLLESLHSIGDNFKAKLFRVARSS